MTIATSLILLTLAALMAVAVAVAAFRRKVGAMRNRMLATSQPVDVSGRVPEKVRDFAVRGGATASDLAHCISFRQQAEMQLKRGGPWQPITAEQIVSVGAPGFLWLAEQPMGPVAKFRVLDAFIAGVGLLQVQLLGVIPVVRAQGADIDRAEAMRYLAELPWAPDAILGNAHLVWRMIGTDWAEVHLTGALDAPVRFRFDAAGDIVEMQADSRPARDAAGRSVVYDWQGYFRDYRMLGPRRVPTEVEVGYVYPDGYSAYFQGRISEYAARH